MDFVRFPDPDDADDDGLLCVGGCLEPNWLVSAYSQGVFPWPIETDDEYILAWFSPDPRAIVELPQFHVSRRLARRMRSGRFTVTLDRAFADVMQGCAGPRKGRRGTWIVPEMMAAYGRLHELGRAHSVEVWCERRLVGGVYGVALGGMFAGESMFHRETDASKIALAALVDHLRQQGFTLFDVQQPTSHLLSLGATTLPRPQFLRRLAAALRLPVHF